MLLTHALEKRDIARETLERYHEINLLYRVAETIGACLNPHEIPHLVLTETNRVIQTDVTVVLLAEAEDEGKFEIKASFGPADHIEALHSASQHLIKQAYHTGGSDIIVPEPVDPVPFGAILYASLKARERILGVVLLGRLKGQPMFTAGDRKLVMALASQAAIAIEKAWLHQQEITQQRLEEELSIGRQIQLSLLPAACPTIPGWEFAAVYQAARQVGGDLYDFFELPGEPQRLGLVIADVTGKGVPAALFMAVSRTIIHTESMTGRRPAAVLKQANHLIVQNSRSQLFLSAFYATLDVCSGQLVFANGGHNWPLWLRRATGECQKLTARGVILGIFTNIELEERKIDMAPGDLLVFYTDGVTEARNAEGRLFGEARLQTTVTANSDASAEQVMQAILDAVKTFAGDTPPSDDFTLFVVKRQEITP
jgi:serine phosphatase RsbU (regulator of sigma subunit)